MTKNKHRPLEGNVRDAALSILIAIEKKQAYSNVLLHKTIESYQLQPKDRALLTELTYGTIQHQMTLDYYLSPFIRGKLEGWVRCLLRLSLYQIHYLTKIPPHAAVHEAVEIAKRHGHKGIAATVNGILRSILRQGVASLEVIDDPIEQLAIATSHPQWLVARWVNMYGVEKAKAMLEENNVTPKQTVRVNTLKATREEVVERLREEGVRVKQSPYIEECLYIENGQATRTKVFQEGYITIQDESSMIPATVLQPKPHMYVLDMCAAPGGKTTHLAQKMNNEGRVIATDLHANKLKLIEENKERLGLSIIETKAMDGRQLATEYAEQTFDAILVDAPCSGLGVIRRKPDIKYTKREEDFEVLQTIQLELLQSAVPLLKEGGTLIYSTCTVDQVENNETVQLFLQKNPNINLEPMTNLAPLLQQYEQSGTMQIFPQDIGSDGFFVANFIKRGV